MSNVIRCEICTVPIGLVGKDNAYKLENHMLWHHPTEQDIEDGMYLLKEFALVLYDSVLDKKDYGLAITYADMLSSHALRIKKYAQLMKWEQDEVS